jgi:hypothetical protein
MNEASITEICTTAVTIVTLIGGFWLQHKQGRATHDAVNSNLTTQQDRVEQITAAMTAANIAVPPAPSKRDDNHAH